MHTLAKIGLVVVWAALAVGCGPKDQRPGLWLSGDAVESPPADWSFTDAHREVALEVRSPYLLPHSVTIWCAFDGDRLYVAARNPDDKRWPGWVERNPDVRLGIGGAIYEGSLVRLDSADDIARVRRAYAAKYELPDPPPEGGPPMRYWAVEPRS